MGSLVGQRVRSGQAPGLGRELYGGTKSWTGDGSYQERLRHAAAGWGVGLVPPKRRGGEALAGTVADADRAVGAERLSSQVLSQDRELWEAAGRGWSGGG